MEFPTTHNDHPEPINETGYSPTAQRQQESFATGPQPTYLTPNTFSAVSHMPQPYGADMSETGGEITEVAEGSHNNEEMPPYSPSGGLLIDSPTIRGTLSVTDRGDAGEPDTPRYHGQLVPFETTGAELDPAERDDVAVYVSGRHEQPLENDRQPDGVEWDTIKTNEAAMQRIASRLGLSIVHRLAPRQAFHFYDDKTTMDEDFVAMTGKPAHSHGNYISMEGIFMVRAPGEDSVPNNSTLRHEQGHNLGYHLHNISVDESNGLVLQTTIQGVQHMRDGVIIKGNAINESLTDYLACLAGRELHEPFTLGYAPFDFVLDASVRETGARLDVSPQVVANQWLRDYFTGDTVAEQATRRAMGDERVDALFQATAGAPLEDTLRFAEQLELPNVAERHEKQLNLFRW